MTRAGILIWLGLLATASGMGLAYCLFSLVISQPQPELLAFFSPKEIMQGQLYSRGLRISFIIGFSLQCCWLAWLIFSGRGVLIAQNLSKAVSGKAVAGGLLFFFLLWLSLQLLSLPFTFFSSFVWPQQWGFSTQTAGGWFWDYIKSTGLELLLTGTGAVLLLWAMQRMPRFWWLAAAAFLSVWIVAASYLWPIIVSPLFNRFTPASNPSVISMVTQLADKAGLPVNEVLVMDASRRTTRSNAYFAGVGETRRIVLYDNLLRDYPPDEVEAVVAHELAHWHQGHITQGMLWGIAGNFIAWGIVFVMIRLSLPGFTQPQPQVWLFILLFAYLGSFVTLPIQNAISRQMEREADAVALKLTENPQAFVRLQIGLAIKNHSDPAPAPYLRLFSTHPPAIERIMAITQDAH